MTTCCTTVVPTYRILQDNWDRETGLADAQGRNNSDTRRTTSSGGQQFISNHSCTRRYLRTYVCRATCLPLEFHSAVLPYRTVGINHNTQDSCWPSTGCFYRLLPSPISWLRQVFLTVHCHDACCLLYCTVRRRINAVPYRVVMPADQALNNHSQDVLAGSTCTRGEGTPSQQQCGRWKQDILADIRFGRSSSSS